MWICSDCSNRFNDEDTPYSAYYANYGIDYYCSKECDPISSSKVRLTRQLWRAIMDLFNRNRKGT